MTKAVGQPDQEMTNRLRLHRNPRKGEAMATVLETTTTRKAPKAFYANLFDQEGALTKVGGTLYFVTEADITEVEPGDCNFLVVLGEMTLSDGQRIQDLMQGGFAAIACSREEGRA